MNIFNMAYYTVLRVLRERKVIINLILMPVLLVLILGTALNSTFNPSKIGMIKVGYLNLDVKAASKYLDEFLKEDEIKSLLDIQTLKSLQEGNALVDEGELAAVIYVGNDFTENIENGKKGKITVYSNGGADYKLTVIQNVIDSFIQGANTTQVMHEISSEQLRFSRNEVVQEMPITIKGNKPGAMDYYAVTMLIMVLMYGTAVGAESMGEDYLGAVGRRIRTFPISNLELLTGKVLGNVLTVFLQGVIILLITKYAFNANWGSNIPFILFVILSMSILSTSIGSVICMFTRDVAHADGLISILVPVSTFIAGGFVNINLSKLMYLSPNYLAQTAIFNTVYGVTSSQTTGCILAIWILILLTMVIAFVSKRRRFDW